MEKPGGGMFTGEMNSTFRRCKVWKEALAMTGPQVGVGASTVPLIVPGDGKCGFRMLFYVRKYLARLIHRESAALCGSEPGKRARMWPHDVSVQNPTRTWLANRRFPEVCRRQVRRS